MGIVRTLVRLRIAHAVRRAGAQGYAEDAGFFTLATETVQGRSREDLGAKLGIGGWERGPRALQARAFARSAGN